MSATLSDGAEDTRAEFEGKPMPRDYPRSFRRAVAGGRWERASWIEARTAERWLTRHVAKRRDEMFGVRCESDSGAADS